jgi:uncharacterized protein YbaR (Trm112 family)
MLSPEYIDCLRCPWDPLRQTHLTLEDERLVCRQCNLKFKIRDGFPVLIVEEAELPPGCDNLEQLPCHRPATPPEKTSSSPQGEDQPVNP